MTPSLLPLAAVLSPTPPPAGGAPDIRSIVPPQQFYLAGSWLWLAYALGFLVLAALVLWLCVRPTKKPSAPPLTPRQLAARRLEELETQMDTLDARSFGEAVADVLRVYIGAQYRLHPERQTSEEFLSSITGSRAFSTVEHALLKEFLEGCDLLKFARADATREGKRRLLGQARNFLENSVEPPTELPLPHRLTLGA